MAVLSIKTPNGHEDVSLSNYHAWDQGLKPTSEFSPTSVWILTHRLGSNILRQTSYPKHHDIS